jgi:hypothetical protein
MCLRRNDDERGRQWEEMSRRERARESAGGTASREQHSNPHPPLTHAARQTIAITTTAVTIHSRAQQQSGARLQPPQLTLQLQ